ncbi:hypothetical protein Ancab_019866 [Ancistrocladus abbreviatus]
MPLSFSANSFLRFFGGESSQNTQLRDTYKDGESSSENKELRDTYKAILKEKFKPSRRLISLQGIEKGASPAVSFDEDKKWLWLDREGRPCFRVLAKDFGIIWGSSIQYWRFSEEQFGKNAKIEVAVLKRVCWFSVSGTMEDLQMLKAKTTYEALLELKMTKEARGWQDPVGCYFEAPSIEKTSNTVNFNTKFRKDNRWKTLELGKFTVPENTSSLENDKIRFQLLQTSGYWKTGLVIRCLTIRAVD